MDWSFSSFILHPSSFRGGVAAGRLTPPSAWFDLGLRRPATQVTLETSQETDDRGIGLSEVAVFLLDVIVPGSSRRDARPAGETSRNRRFSGKDDPSRADAPLNRPPRIARSGLKAALNRRTPSRPVGFPRAGMSCVTPVPDSMGAQCQNWE
jgi:hypothetical protein